MRAGARKARGFTLVELLTVLTVLSLLWGLALLPLVRRQENGASTPAYTRERLEAVRSLRPVIVMPPGDTVLLLVDGRVVHAASGSGE